MLRRTISCFGQSCVDVESQFFEATESKKNAKRQNKEIHMEDLKPIKLLLLGTGDSGKSTFMKQMKIIHIHGFNTRERKSKIADIKLNIKDSIVVISLAMQYLGLSLEKDENKSSLEFILSEAGSHDIQHNDLFMYHTKRLWTDGGMQQCYLQSYKYQLLDSAKYFLDRVEEIKNPDYIPTDQVNLDLWLALCIGRDINTMARVWANFLCNACTKERVEGVAEVGVQSRKDILRCSVNTTSIHHIEFDVPESVQRVRFSLYDIGGQRGERNKWFQVFESAFAVIFMVDCGAVTQTLKEDSTKNRLLESLEIFEQVWKTRYLRIVTVLIFLNKTDILAEKIANGWNISKLHTQFPDVFPDFQTFNVTNSDRQEFEDSFPGAEQMPKREQNVSQPDINPDVTKTAVYIKHMFLKIVKSEICLRKSEHLYHKDWHQEHQWSLYYTCAMDTKNVQKVFEGCQTLLIPKDVQRFRMKVF